MKDTLELVEDRDYRYRLQWYLAEEDDMGGYLGDFPSTPEEYLATCEDDERIAFLVAQKSAERDSSGFYWDMKGKAVSALKEIKEAWKDHAQAKKKGADKGSLLAKYVSALATCLTAGATEEDLMNARKEAAVRAGK